MYAQAALSGKGTSLDEAGALPKGPSPTCTGHGSRGLDGCGGGGQCRRPGGAGRRPPFQLSHSRGGFWARWLGLRGCHAPALRHRGPCAQGEIGCHLGRSCTRWAGGRPRRPWCWPPVRPRLPPVFLPLFLIQAHLVWGFSLNFFSTSRKEPGRAFPRLQHGLGLAGSAASLCACAGRDNLGHCVPGPGQPLRRCQVTPKPCSSYF